MGSATAFLTSRICKRSSVLMCSAKHRSFLRMVSPAIAIGGLASALVGQVSNDECSNRILIAGSPVTIFQDANNATTGTDGQNAQACNAFNTRHINNDQWF